MATKEIVIPYSPRDAFMPFHNRQTRWAIIVAHRRAGKTVATLNDLIKRAITDGKQDGRYGYIAPYYSQAKSVAWDYLKYYCAPISKQIREADPKSIDLINGSRITIYGGDNPNALRGLYFDGIVLDEMADMRGNIMGEILRPALSDRQGWCTYIGTPKGHDAFFDLYQRGLSDPDWFTGMFRASETNIIPASELEDARKGMTHDQYQQEFECSFEAAIHGAIYAKELDEARANNRITSVPYDKTLKVNTVWDLGVGDATSIWFFQKYGRECRIIDYYEASGEGLPHYAQVLQARGYLYDAHYAPHDIQVRELGSGRSRLETAASLGINFQVVPQASLEDGIHAGRMIMSKCVFDANKCKIGLESLQHYRWDYNDKMGEFKNRPVHDWSSHAADAYRYLSLVYNDQAPRKAREIGNISWMG